MGLVSWRLSLQYLVKSLLFYAFALLIYIILCYFSYEKSARCEKMGYEEELMKFLTTVIAEADKRIQRGYERLEMAAKETHAVS